MGQQIPGYPSGGPTGTRWADITGRFPIERQPSRAHGGIMRGFDHAYEVNWRTGQPHSNVEAGNWERGDIVRGSTYNFVLPPGWPDYDPTDPTMWV